MLNRKLKVINVTSNLIGKQFIADGHWPNMPHHTCILTITKIVDKKRVYYTTNEGSEGIAHIDWLNRFWKEKTE